MSLANILNATLDLGLDALTDVGLPADRSGVYHSEPPVRCCFDGEDVQRNLFVYWRTGYVGGSTGGAFPSRHSGEDHLAEPQTYEIRLRYFQCFPTIENNAEMDLLAQTAASLEIAQAAEAIVCAFQEIVCNANHSYHVSTNRTGCNGYIQIDDVNPIPPDGFCGGFDAGITIANQSACS